MYRLTWGERMAAAVLAVTVGLLPWLVCTAGAVLAIDAGHGLLALAFTAGVGVATYTGAPLLADAVTGVADLDD